jgi:hypothetical protein
MGYSHPQYKTGASRRNFPLSDVNISGYGGLGIPANFPGAVLQAAAPTGSAGGYDIFHSQYQERNNFTTRQQVMVIGFPLFLYEHSFCFVM